MRPYGGYFYNLGRETFLVPIRWENGWPIVSPGTGRVEFTYPKPNLPEASWPAQPGRDDFNGSTFGYSWCFLRTPREDFWSLSERPGYLRLKLRPEMLSEQVNPSFVGRRQQHIHFEVQTAFDFNPQNESESAGLVLNQNTNFHIRFVVTRDTTPVIRLIRRAQGVEEILAHNRSPAADFPQNRSTRTKLQFLFLQYTARLAAARQKYGWPPFEHAGGGWLRGSFYRHVRQQQWTAQRESCRL